MDDRGFPDQSDEYDTLLHNVDGGPILRKLKHPAPPLDVHDPSFHFPFDEALHGERLREQLDLSHLDPSIRLKVTDLIKEFWSVFDERGVWVPVRNYECVIDTGKAPPIAIKKIQYGPKEIPIMRKAIAALEKVGHIRQIHDGRWLFKAVLAPKPHQEHVNDIDDFVWRFCVNYVPLNAVTRVIAYPIPRCNTAVFIEFGTGGWLWLFDAPSGYHQLAVAQSSQEKLAFQGTDAIKWTYTVMPFGPTNGPATFINFIHDVDSQWKALATSHGISIDEQTNTRIIVDDILSHGRDLDTSLLYMRCQLRVCLAYRLSLSLRKSFIFPKRFEFVGNDVCPDGNRPAQSKHQLLTTWPQPEQVRDIAKFIGFVQFYSRFIHHFELRVTPLRELVTNNDYSDPVGPIWNDAAQVAMDDLRNSILADPCLMRFNPNRLVVLRTDFSAKGFGYVICQPGTDAASEQAMAAFLAGHDFTFMTKESSAVLRPVAFGGRRCRGNESRLHSHLGEGFAGDWAINKNRHYLFGTRFVWVTDCYAIKFILSYDGNNPAILRLQMRLMCWDMTIVHRNDTHLADADYWSRLGEDICFDPHFRDYLRFDKALRASSPAPTDLPMLPQNMPYYRGPRITTQVDSSNQKAETSYCECLLSSITSIGNASISPLSHVPVQFGYSDTVTPDNAHASLNHEIPCLAHNALRFSWAGYSFGGGHFASTITSRNLPFCVTLACDQYESGRAMFREFTSCMKIFNTGNEMLDYIRGSGDSSHIHGYLIHSLRFKDSDTTSTFWQLQGTIVSQLRSLRDLQMVVAIILPDHDNPCVKSFIKTLTSAGWVMSKHDVSFPAQGDCVAGTCMCIVGVHSSCASVVKPILLKAAPPTPRDPLAYLYGNPSIGRNTLSPLLGTMMTSVVRISAFRLISLQSPSGQSLVLSSNATCTRQVWMKPA